MSAHPSRRSSFVLALCALGFAQTPISVGKGSYASAPPPEAGSAVDSFQRISRLDVLPTETRPIPTNDWWSYVLVNPFAGDLWSHPLVTAPDAQGVRFWYPIAPAANGDGMQRGDPIRISGTGFSPTRDLAADWGDWHVVVRLEDGAKHLDMTLARGMPIAWFEATGFAPTLSVPAGAKVSTSAGAALGTASIPTDQLLIEYGGRSIGAYLPTGSSASLQAGIVSISFPSGQSWFSLAGLPTAKDLDAWRAWATVVPRSTKVTWERTPASTMKVVYEVAGQDLTGSGNKDVVQTFPPHAWRDASAAPAWRNETWLCPRGRLKTAVGTRFSFEYPMPGIVPDFGIPETDATGTPAPWSKEVQNDLISKYLAKATYGADTYWGGKDLVLLAKHAVFARRTGHPEAATLLAKARAALVDWLTWTPGETAHYFAWYPRWKALVGFQESYGSSQFTDNHFHYGYLVHAAALVGSLDQQFLSDYGPMLRKIVQQYANWDRSSAEFPFLRTFEPWTGHSYAGGTSSPTGNNQESTSEAMQSWIGQFLLGSAMGDTAMRDAGAFGYLMESRATMEYWFDWKRDNFAPGWAHTNVGIVFDGGNSYGTWFSANPLHIHAIQYLPIAPGFDYLARDTAWARSEYAAMQREAAAAEGYADETDYGDDWANVAFSFRQLFEPGEVCRRFATDRAAGKGWTTEVNAGVTYAYSHANRQLGPRAWDYSYSLPTVAGFRDPKTGIVTHLAWNPSGAEVVCDVRSGGTAIGSIRIPPRSVVRHRMDAKIARLEIAAPGKTLPTTTASQMVATGIDQYGASIEPGSVAWATSSGSIDAKGVFSPAGASDSVRITATAAGLSSSLTVRVGATPKISRLRIHPAYVQMLVGEARRIQVRGLDQYGDEIGIANPVWSSRGGAQVGADGTTTSTVAGTSWIRVEADGIRDSVPVDVYERLLDLSTSATATASSSLGANTATRTIDGSRTTRWESEHGIDSSWIQLALDGDYELTQTVVDWENAAASRYLVQVSIDGRNWTNWTSVTGGNGGIDSLQGSGHGRFVRVLGLARTTAYGYSIWELRLRGFPRTGFSQLLDADTARWDDPSSVAKPRIGTSRRKLRFGGRTFSVLLPDDEKILSARLVGTDGREIPESFAGTGVGHLQVSTNSGWRTETVYLAPR